MFEEQFLLIMLFKGPSLSTSTHHRYHDCICIHSSVHSAAVRVYFTRQCSLTATTLTIVLLFSKCTACYLYYVSAPLTANMAITWACHRTKKCFNCERVAKGVFFDKPLQSKSHLTDTATVSLSSTIWSFSCYFHSVETA